MQRRMLESFRLVSARWGQVDVGTVNAPTVNSLRDGVSHLSTNCMAADAGCVPRDLVTAALRTLINEGRSADGWEIKDALGTGRRRFDRFSKAEAERSDDALIPLSQQISRQ